jgi:hypothetical protein
MHLFLHHTFFESPCFNCCIQPVRLTAKWPTIFCRLGEEGLLLCSKQHRSSYHLKFHSQKNDFVLAKLVGLLLVPVLCYLEMRTILRNDNALGKLAH